MHDLILEIDSIVWLIVIAFGILAVMLSLFVGENDVKREPDLMKEMAEPVIPDSPPREDKPIGMYKKKTSAPVDSTISKYQSAKLWSCACEIKMLERLNLVADSRVGPEPTQNQPKIKRDDDDKKRGPWD
jgi:hypothetical protein